MDGVDQTIEADENTSFRRGGGRFGTGAGGPGGSAGAESITLPDIKVGDTILARGELKNDVFVPSAINVVDPEMARRMKEGGGMFMADPGIRGNRGSQSQTTPQTSPKQ